MEVLVGLKTHEMVGVLFAIAFLYVSEDSFIL